MFSVIKSKGVKEIMRAEKKKKVLVLFGVFAQRLCMTFGGTISIFRMKMWQCFEKIIEE